jgi:hypothetical protein
MQLMRNTTYKVRLARYQYVPVISQYELSCLWIAPPAAFLLFSLSFGLYAVYMLHIQACHATNVV